MQRNMMESKIGSAEPRWKLMDIHSHILPGIDDGAGDMEETLQMAGQANQEGISVIIATPHYGRRNPRYDPGKAEQVFDAVKIRIQQAYPHMKLYMGNELYYSSGILEDVKAGRAKTIGGTDYVLVEFSTDAEYEFLAGAVRSCVREGYRPILAHVERYSCLYKDTGRIDALIEQGAYVQVNARGFLPGSRSDKRRAWCRTLLMEGLIHFVASDCHNTGSRKPVLHSAVEEIVKIAGIDEAKRIINANIIKLIRNEYI